MERQGSRRRLTSSGNNNNLATLVAGYGTRAPLSAARPRLGWDPQVGCFHLFEVNVDHLTYIRYDPVTEHQHVAMWPPAREFIRQHATATSLKDPQPAADIISSP
jgi:hypothetical protein